MTFLISGCKSLDTLPINGLRVPQILSSIIVDGKVYYEGVCSIREVTDKKTLSSRRVRVGGLGECNGVIGVPPQDFAKTRVWIRDIEN